MCALTDRVDAKLLAGAARLKVVANIAVGYNNIDLAACSARGIMATNTPGVLDDSTADLAWTLMLAAARRATELERRVRAGEWTGWQLKQWLGVDVHHATLGIFGMGRIGQAIARRAAGFEMKVIYHNRKRVAADIEKRLNATYVAREELLRQSDFVVLQMPYSPETHHLIGAAELKLMKPTAILINSTRGGVVDDAALIAALKSRHDPRRGARRVRRRADAESRRFSRWTTSCCCPTSAAPPRRRGSAMAMTAAKNAVAALTGETPPNLLNPEV